MDRTALYCAFEKDRICDRKCASYVPCACMETKDDEGNYYYDDMVDQRGTPHPESYCLHRCVWTDDYTTDPKDPERRIPLSSCDMCKDMGFEMKSMGLGGFCIRLESLVKK